MEKEKRLIIFTDSGDTIIDESTQRFDGRGIVTDADFIEDAGRVLEEFSGQGYRIALVADGEEESFQNVYKKNGLRHCFEGWVVSETVGVQKPERPMFETAMEALGLTEADKPRIVMIGNNLAKDVAGANRFGILSVWLDWSPRYFHEYEKEDWKPDYVVHHPAELPALLEKLEKEIEMREAIDEKLGRLIGAFAPILYEDDEIFMQNMRTKKHISEQELAKYAHWEWTQGVGLYGLWKLFEVTGKEEYLELLTKYYDSQQKVGFPPLNVNTMAPYLVMSMMAERLGREDYMEPCRQAARWIMEEMPRTREGGIQHQTSDDTNEQELWDDTLFMTVLFLANMGRILGREDYKKEAQYQFLLHLKYLQDPKTGFWYHGWSFLRRDNFAGAFWARGNCWITIAIPELLSLIECPEPVRRILTGALENQVEALAGTQAKSGMWHTLLDDPDSYEEASGTCGFAYGILRGVHTGVLDKKWLPVAKRALEPVLSLISEDGVLGQVSYGTPMGRESRDFYKEIPLKPMPYGQALAILFLVEEKIDGK
ncbi:MAG: glycoside hydrolase family 88 protein [Eubacteriales bacterium]|nr:glycoside hydrolase family 88 protein [Eubacteriales bacterium]